MFSICLIALLSGAILGLMYRTFALVPASLAMIGLVVVVEIARDQRTALIALACALSVLLLQAGYLVASLVVHHRLHFKRQWRRVGLPDRAV